MNRLFKFLNKPVYALDLACFRIIFGVLLSYFYFYYLADDIDYFWTGPKYNFKYPFFSFVNSLPQDWMRGLTIALAINALVLAAGLFMRLAAFLNFLGILYLFLLERSWYQNHYYLIVILSLFFVCTDANICWSLDRFLRLTKHTETVAYWQQQLFKVQFAIVYFFAGLAKLNPDWLQGKPFYEWLLTNPHHPLALAVAPHQEIAASLISISGAVLDLAASFFLFHNRLKWVVLPFLAVFHLSNSFLFHIGVFPYLMLGSLIFFFAPQKQAQQVFQGPLKLHNLGLFCALGWLLIQIILPLRHFMYSDNLSWGWNGKDFAWQMKIDYSRVEEIAFRVWVPNEGFIGNYDFSKDLNRDQISQLATRADFQVAYAKYIKKKFEDAGYPNSKVFGHSTVSLNGRSARPMIDETIDLASIDEPFGTPHWIIAHPEIP